MVAVVEVEVAVGGLLQYFSILKSLNYSSFQALISNDLIALAVILLIKPNFEIFARLVITVGKSVCCFTTWIQLEITQQLLYRFTINLYRNSMIPFVSPLIFS